MSGRLVWNGDAIKKRLEEAQRLAIDETCGTCVALTKDELQQTVKPAHSQPGQPPARWNGLLQGSIQFRPAEKEGHRFVGRWGSYDVKYALFLEIGTATMGARPYLRPTAEREYPKLAARVRARFAR